MGRGLGTAVIGLAAVGVVAAVGYGVLTGDGPLGTVGDTCTATVDGRTVELEVEQAENAALITAISVRRGLPARAASIALATAYQESDLYNIDYGDRDSVGLFQQRPSQGWGTVEEILDPVYATNAFYDELVEVDGTRRWRSPRPRRRCSARATPAPTPTTRPTPGSSPRRSRATPAAPSSATSTTTVTRPTPSWSRAD